MNGMRASFDPSKESRCGACRKAGCNYERTGDWCDCPCHLLRGEALTGRSCQQFPEVYVRRGKTMSIPKPKTIEDLEALESEVNFATTAFLQLRGWSYSCSNPASMWLWAKTIDGFLYSGVSTETALQFERVHYKE